MNVEEKVATLEALLARVKNNAAKPRVQHLAAEPNGEARLAKPAARAAELEAPPARPVEKVAPTLVEAEPPDPIEAQFEKLLQTKVERLLEAKVEKPVEARAAKPADATVDPTDVWADALDAIAEVPKVQEKPPVVAATTAKRDEPAPIAAKAVTPIAAKPITPRPITPVARPVAVRPTLGTKPEATPSPTPTAAKVPEAAKPVEKIDRAITPPKPVEKIAPVVAAPKPVEKIAPVVAPAKPVEKVAAIAKPTEKVEAIKPVEAAVAAAPVKVQPLPVAAPSLPAEMPPKPVEPVQAKLVEEKAKDKDNVNEDETRRLDGSIPDPDLAPLGDETTSDDETIVVSLPRAAEEPTTDAATKAEADEATHIFDSRPSRPETLAVTLEKGASRSVTASDGDDLKVVVSPAVRAPSVVETVVPAAAENAAAITIVETEVPATPPSDTSEVTAPSRRYSKPSDEVAEPVAPPRSGRRASRLTLALVAAVLLGAGIFRGVRDGWFSGSKTPVVSTSPTASALPAPTLSAPTITTASAAAPGSAAPTTSAAAPEPTSSASAAPATSADAVPSASASAAPSAAPAADSDGTQLPANRGFVIVNSAKLGSVFLTGRFVGVTSTKLEVDCGAKFLRLAAPTADGAPRPATPEWTSEGVSIGVACRSTTKITLEATR